MRYLQWLQQVRLLAQTQQIENWESMAVWREHFLNGLKPDAALKQAKIDAF